MISIRDKIWGSLFGSAIGNAMGSMVECKSYEWIEKTYGKILEPLMLARIQSEDDNRIAMLYSEAYKEYKRNLTPEDLAQTWMKSFDPGTDFFWCMRNTLELLKQGVSPRQTGMYNINTGSAIMAIAPVGIYNMFEPDRAFADALDLAYMYQPKPDAYAAAAFAAGLSTAFHENITTDQIADTILKYVPNEDWKYWDNRPLSNPHKSVQIAIEIADKYNNDWWAARKEIYEKLTQWHCIDPVEVLSLTVCLMKLTKGDYLNGVQAGTNLGRDTDTISNLIGSVAGAMHGIEAIPADWREAVQEISPPLFDKFRNTANDFFSILQSKWSHYRNILKCVEENHL